MKSKKPNMFRCALPFVVGIAPSIAALFWLHLVSVVHAMAKLPPPTIPGEVEILLGVVMISGSLLTVYRAWADFGRGDYYFDLADWQEGLGRRRW